MIIPYQRHGRLVGQYLFVCLDGKVSQDLRLIILHIYIYIYKRLQLGTAKNPLVEVEDDNDRGERSFFFIEPVKFIGKRQSIWNKKNSICHAFSDISWINKVRKRPDIPHCYG